MNTVRVLFLRIIANQGPRVDHRGCVRYWRSEGPGSFETAAELADVGLETGNPHNWATPLPIAFVSGSQAEEPGMKCLG